MLLLCVSWVSVWCPNEFRSLAVAAARVLAVADSSSFEVITHMSLRVNRKAWS